MLLPQAQAIVDRMASAFPPLGPGSDIGQARDRLRELQRAAAVATPEKVGAVRDVTISSAAGPIAARLYRPVSVASAERLPVVLYYHGGGWVLGDLDSHDGYCRMLTNRSGCALLSVEYRLAPEHRYPAAVEDAYAALVWAVEKADDLGVDPRRVAVAGDSAGGNLAAAVSLMARDRKGPQIAFQVLVAPALDRRFDTPSHLGQGVKSGLTSESVRFYWSQYLADNAHGEEPYASPLRANDFTGLPPTLVILPSKDPLRSEGGAYADRLVDAGIDAHVSVYAGMFHGFWTHNGALAAADQALDEAGYWLRFTLRPGSDTELMVVK